MNTFQIIMVVLAALLGLSVIASPVWAFLKDMFANVKTNDILNKVKVNKTPKEKPSLVDIVSYWEVLKDACSKAELKEAERELEAIFPLFAKKSKEA